MTMRSASHSVSMVAPSRRAASAKPKVVAFGSANPEPGSQQAAPMSSTRMAGTSRRRSSLEIGWVSMPIRCCMATLACKAFSYPGATTWTKPIG